MRFGLAVATAAAVGFAAAPASAQYYRYQAPAYAPPAYTPYGAAYGGGYCVKMCPHDLTPCDPPEFKRTDGRCANPLGGSVR